VGADHGLTMVITSYWPAGGRLVAVAEIAPELLKLCTGGREVIFPD
jgi:hypothetical protein